MAQRLHPDDLRAYRDRPWAQVRRAKEEYWAQTAREQGPSAGLKASTALWLHARAVDPDWPTPEERRADLEHHRRMSNLYRRLADAFARR